MELILLKDVIVIFALSIIILFVFNRLQIPVVVGFILTGILVGPQGLGLIQATDEVRNLADISIILMLFTIGIDFSVRNLLQIRRPVLIGGSLQVVLTFIASFAISVAAGQIITNSIFLGFLVSLSSTAIVLKILQDRAEINSPHGSTALGILIFQDIAIVPMMLVTPLLAGASRNISYDLLFILAKGLGVIVLVIIAARWIVPFLLYQITRTRSRELFLLSIVLIGLGVAWLTASVGLSLALGAFLAGLIISESEYSQQALGNIVPFRDAFTSFFFVSIGMLLNVGFLLKEPVLIIAVTIGVLLVKGLMSSIAIAITGLSLRVTLLTGLALSQIGEFSFILSQVGTRYGLLSGSSQQLFLDVTILSMALTPLVIAIAPRIADMALLLPVPDKLKTGWYPAQATIEKALSDHLIIIGFGLNGRNLARAASAANIPYVIVETNPETVRLEREKGMPIYYGDATHDEVLKHVDIDRARVVVVAISDPAATRRIIEVARRLNPGIYILVRTRFANEVEPLYKLGANEVVPEEFETSVEIFSRVLARYFVPTDEIENFVNEVRSEGYEMFRKLQKKSLTIADIGLHLPNIELRTLRVAEHAAADGKTLGMLQLRKIYAVSVLAIRRDSQTISNPDGDTQLYANDIVIVVGEKENIDIIEYIFHNAESNWEGQ